MHRTSKSALNLWEAYKVAASEAANGKSRMIGCAAVLTAGCASNKYKEGERMARQPINCATAEGDIRALRAEKAHAKDQISAGVESISPAGAVVGLISGSEGENLKVASGKYNKMIDKRIAQIKAQCGVK